MGSAALKVHHKQQEWVSVQSVPPTQLEWGSEYNVHHTQIEWRGQKIMNITHN